MMPGTRAYLTFILLLMLLAHSPAAPDSGSATSSTPAFQELEAVVNTSEDTSSYRLNVDFDIDVSDREDPITITSRGRFQSPYYRLLSETPSGMEVKSFGKDEQVLHIHPSTDEIVTSEKLGISSVNRTLLDPFKHMAYVLDPGYEDVSVTQVEDERVDGEALSVLRVEVGSEPVRDVMNEFRDQLKRPLKAGDTTAVYRILFDPSSRHIRRIHLTADSEFVKPEEEDDREKWQNDLPEPEGGGEQEKGPVQIHVDATFDLMDYGGVQDLNIPGDVDRLLSRKSN